jgi:membrane-associated protease RseP (regulator of RpoE activity)
MKEMQMKTRLLCLFIAAALSAGSANASDKTPRPESAQQQATRAEIDRLVERIEQLSEQLDDGDGRRKIHIERLGPGEAPRALPPGGKWEMQLPKAAFGSGPGLGIVLASNPAAAGVRIAAVTPDSPASRAGVRTGDVVLQVNGRTIAGAGNAAVENARAMIGELRKGQVVKLRYARQGKTHDASIKADDIRRVWAFSGDAPAPRAIRGDTPGPHFRHAEIEELLPPGVEMEVQRLGDVDCHKGKKDCGLPVIYEAFRWQGLNLASLDAGLGRYFGTRQGVLVLSSGEELEGLQSGDVIQKVGGSAVDSPRDVMRALRGKRDGASVRMDVLRDRRALAVTVVVPKSRPLPFLTPPPAPPAPPAPPTPPMAPPAPHAAPPALPAAPPMPPAAPPPPPPPPLRGSAV